MCPIIPIILISVVSMFIGFSLGAFLAGKLVVGMAKREDIENIQGHWIQFKIIKERKT